MDVPPELMALDIHIICNSCQSPQRTVRYAVLANEQGQPRRSQQFTARDQALAAAIEKKPVSLRMRQSLAEVEAFIARNRPIAESNGDVRVMARLRGRYNPPRTEQRLPTPLAVNPPIRAMPADSSQSLPVPPSNQSQKEAASEKQEASDKELTRFSLLEVD
jgi:hypothetical protein